jgi:RNA polymerase sigma-70 factor (ECF subfamily)
MAEELDALTLARARRGESNALSQLVRHYQRPVFALCARLLCSRRSAQVEDVAQEAFIRVIRGLPRFDPQGSARLSTWILTVATRTCLNAMRGKQREVPLLDQPGEGVDGHRHGGALPSQVAETPSPEQSAVERDLARRVETAMSRLPEEMRAVLVLRAYHDLDYPEIASALELEVGTVKSRLSRARTALREALQGSMSLREKEQRQ